MADLYVPYTNPIRLHRTDKDVDYSDVLPHDDVMYLRQDYQKGQYAVEDLYPNFALNEEISLGYVYEYGEDKTVIVRNMVTNDTFTVTVDEYEGQYLYPAYTFTEEGFYRFEITLDLDTFNLISDIFVVKDWSESKDLVKFNFYDSRNRYGGYYFTSVGNQVWNPLAFYTGNTKSGQPEDEQSKYEGNNGNTTTLSSDPKRIKILTLTDISDKYVDVIKQQTICDNFYVNGLRYDASDFSVEETPNSDVVDITIKLTLKDNDYNSILQ